MVEESNALTPVLRLPNLGYDRGILGFWVERSREDTDLGFLTVVVVPWSNMGGRGVDGYCVTGNGGSLLVGDGEGLIGFCSSEVS